MKGFIDITPRILNLGARWRCGHIQAPRKEPSVFTVEETGRANFRPIQGGEGTGCGSRTWRFARSCFDESGWV